MQRKGFILVEVVTAAAIIVLAAFALTAALAGASNIFHAARAITKGRLLAVSHLEQAAAGVVQSCLREGNLRSTLTLLEVDGLILWQVEVRGPGLTETLVMVGGP